MKKFSNVVVDDGRPKIYFYESGVKDIYRWDVYKGEGVVLTLENPKNTPAYTLINKIINRNRANIFYNGCVYFVHKDMISELGELFKVEGQAVAEPHTALQIQKKAKGLMVLSVGKILRKEATHAMKLPEATSKAALLKLNCFKERMVGKETYKYDIEELQDVLGAKPLSLDKFKYFYKKELDSVEKELLPWEDEEKWVEEVTRRKEQRIVNINDLDSPKYNKSAFKPSKVEELAEEDHTYNSRIDEMIAEHNRMITKLEDMKR